MNIRNFYLVEFHELDFYICLSYNISGIPRTIYSENMKVAFFGHRKLYNLDKIKRKTIQTLLEIVKNNSFVEFFCGGYGDFDNICFSIAKDLKQNNNNIKLSFVTPYIYNSYLSKINFSLYDEIIYPPIENSPKRLAILKRNEWIVNQSDLIIIHVETNFGGAYQALKYSERKNKQIIII